MAAVRRRRAAPGCAGASPTGLPGWRRGSVPLTSGPTVAGGGQWMGASAGVGSRLTGGAAPHGFRPAGIALPDRWGRPPSAGCVSSLTSGPGRLEPSRR
ncbi:hypothetical protein DAI22_03g047566 [Oryza sativa Japonica Group]|nr:hypothetical protein DAI22_03g047566 [Oryza sativa Japonica Group]